MARDYKSRSSEATLYPGAARSKKCAGIADGILHCVVRFILKGFFNTHTILGYTQFMIYVVLRVIILGSLFGGLFCHEDDLLCPIQSEIGQNTTVIAENTSEDIKQECLRTVYYNGLSPLNYWALSLLTAAIPWLILLPWTPGGPEQENADCFILHCRWPCLTIYMSAFIRTLLRAILEALFAMLGVVIYGKGLAHAKECITDKNSLFCTMNLHEEKSYVVWMLFFVNVFCCFLSTAEIVDMCRNASKYSEENKTTMKVVRRLSRITSLDSNTIIGTLKKEKEKSTEKKERKRRIAMTRSHNFNKDESCPNGKFSKNRHRKRQEHAPDEMIALIVTSPKDETLVKNKNIEKCKLSAVHSTTSTATDNTTIINEDSKDFIL